MPPSAAAAPLGGNVTIAADGIHSLAAGRHTQARRSPGSSVDSLTNMPYRFHVVNLTAAATPDPGRLHAW
jgi:hypothetical protein